MQNFRKLDVWVRAHALAKTIHNLTRSLHDASPDFKAQLSRAAESIASNIVEGCGAATNRELARYLDISIKSAFELDYRLELAKDYEYISETEWAGLYAEVVEIRKMLFRFREVVLGRDLPKAVRDRRRRPKRPSRQRRRDADRRLADERGDTEGGDARIPENDLSPDDKPDVCN